MLARAQTQKSNRQSVKPNRPIPTTFKSTTEPDNSQHTIPPNLEETVPVNDDQTGPDMDIRSPSPGFESEHGSRNSQSGELLCSLYPIPHHALGDMNNPTSTVPISMSSLYTDLDKVNIRIEYHPSSGAQHETMPLQQYLTEKTRTIDMLQSTQKNRSQNAPWHPFSSMADFSFAEFVTNNHLSNSTIDDLLKRMKGEWGGTKVTFKSHKDMTELLEYSDLLVPIKVIHGSPIKFIKLIFL
jgi:hypothetical protein